MNRGILFPVLYFISVLIFDILNWYGAKITPGIFNIMRFAVITLPIQFIGFVFIAQSYNIGYNYFGNLYEIVLISATISWVTKLVTAYAFDQKIPSQGQIIALALILIAQVIGKFWK